MAEVVFYEKPGCAANAQQKLKLQAAGHKVVTRDLTTEPLTVDTLRPFFSSRPVEQWFNRTHPAVRARTIDPSTLDESAALAAMLEDRDLIRRPLIQVDDRCEAGFDPNMLNQWIGMTPVSDGMSCDDKHAQGRCDHGHHHHHHHP
jgi:nitrogenase-associated protein